MVQSTVHSMVHGLVHSMVHSMTHSMVHSLVHSMVHDMLHSEAYNMVQSTVHSMVHVTKAREGEVSGPGECWLLHRRCDHVHRFRCVHTISLITAPILQPALSRCTCLGLSSWSQGQLVSDEVACALGYTELSTKI
eukprot:1160532-Pelagomonas_calceolata.AAC.12